MYMISNIAHVSCRPRLDNICMALLCPFMAKKDSANFIIFVPQKQAVSIVVPSFINAQKQGPWPWHNTYSLGPALCVIETGLHTYCTALSQLNTHTHWVHCPLWTEPAAQRQRPREKVPTELRINLLLCLTHSQRNRNCFPCTGSLQMSVTKPTASAPWICWPAVAVLSVRHRWRWRGDRCWCFCRCCSLKL